MNDAGYEAHTSNGPRVRTDVVDVYVFRRSAGAGGSGPGDVEFLQLLRAGEPLKGTWHPVMGHVEPGETAVMAAVREMREEVGLDVGSPVVRGFFALEQTHPFFIAAINAIVMSPRFAVEVEPGHEPTLNGEHSAHRWVNQRDVDEMFMWPGQKGCCREILAEIVADVSLSREALRVRL